MKAIFKETINQMVSENLQTTACKEQLKKSIIDYFVNDGEYGFMKIDEIVKSILNEQDWKDIAKAIGEDIQVVGDLAFTNYGISTSGLWNKYKAKPVKSIKPMKVKKFEINDGTEIIDGTEIVVIEDDGLLSFYGKRSRDDLFSLVMKQGKIEEVSDDMVFSISNKYSDLISDLEKTMNEAEERAAERAVEKT